jgi:GT2 family glycosyltransferase
MEQVGYFDENLARWEDSDYLVRLAQKYPVYMLNKSLVIWHVTPGSITGGGFCKLDIISRKRFLYKHFDLMKKDKDYSYRFCWSLGKDFRQIDMIPEAKDCFIKAWLIKPYKFEALGQLFCAC